MFLYTLVYEMIKHVQVYKNEYVTEKILMWTNIWCIPAIVPHKHNVYLFIYPINS